MEIANEKKKRKVITYLLDSGFVESGEGTYESRKLGNGWGSINTNTHTVVKLEGMNLEIIPKCKTSLAFWLLFIGGGLFCAFLPTIVAIVMYSIASGRYTEKVEGLTKEIRRIAEDDD